MLSIYLATLAGVVLAQISPGPNLLAVASAALGQGRRAALFVTLGVATAIFAWVSMASVGLAALFTAFPSLLMIMKMVGGLYLSYLAVKALRSSLGSDRRLAIDSREVAMSSMTAWRKGLFVNLTNPKSGLMWCAVTTLLFGAGLSTWQVLAFAPVGFLSALAVYGTYSVLFSMGRVRESYARVARCVEGAFGLAFGALGGSLLLSGLRDLTR